MLKIFIGQINNMNNIKTIKKLEKISNLIKTVIHELRLKNDDSYVDFIERQRKQKYVDSLRKEYEKS